MKRLILFCALILPALQLFAAEIATITIPKNLCPTETRTYKVNYYLSFNLPYVYDRVYKVIWEFSQNGVVILTKNSSSGDFVPIAPYGEANVSVGNLPLGNLKVKVTLKYYLVTPMATIPYEEAESKTFSVGLSAPTAITGSPNICNGVPSTYSISPITNATSYTWEVPAGWSVNGILGPIVTEQGSSVSIASCSGSALERSASITCSPTFSVNTIKVKAVNTSCGESSSVTKNITTDYPATVSHAYRSSTSIIFTASPSNLPSYQWDFPSYWQADGTTASSAMVYHNSQSGTAKLYYTTFCSGNTFVTSDFFAYVPPGGGGGCDEPLPVAYPNPATDLLTVDLPCEEQLYSSMQIEDNGSFKTIETSRDGNQYSIDVSSLKPGLHILRFKKEHGKAQYIRFMKSK